MTFSVVNFMHEHFWDFFPRLTREDIRIGLEKSWAVAARFFKCLQASGNTSITFFSLELKELSFLWMLRHQIIIVGMVTPHWALYDPIRKHSAFVINYINPSFKILWYMFLALFRSAPLFSHQYFQSSAAVILDWAVLYWYKAKKSKCCISTLKKD